MTYPMPFGSDYVTGVGFTSSNSASNVFGNNSSTANAIGDFFGFGNEQRNREYNSAEAAAERAWSEHMRDTNYTSAYKQMQEIGFNPALAFMEGQASAPGGASASNTSSGASGMSLINSASHLLGTALVTKAITSRNSGAAKAFWNIVRFLK